jgi:5'(3')-deoxyribonucleotidase
MIVGNMENKKIIKIDIDGVLRNLSIGMCEVYNHEFDTNFTPDDINHYNVNKVFTKCEEYLNKTAFEFFFKNYGFFVFRHSPIFEKAKEAVDLLHENGYRVVIVSPQLSYESRKLTLEWLEANNIYYDDICFTSQKNMIKGDYMIDDYPKNLEMCEGETQILIDAPYNKWCDSYKRYSSIYDFAKDLINYVD